MDSSGLDESESVAAFLGDDEAEAQRKQREEDEKCSEGSSVEMVQETDACPPLTDEKMVLFDAKDIFYAQKPRLLELAEIFGLPATDDWSKPRIRRALSDAFVTFNTIKELAAASKTTDKRRLKTPDKRYLSAARGSDEPENDGDALGPEQKKKKTKSQLLFNTGPTVFTWPLSKKLLRKCDALKKEWYLTSKTFADKNGCHWKLEFYPKGSDSAKTQNASLFLSPVELQSAGIKDVRVNCTLSHVESDISQSAHFGFNADCPSDDGFDDFMDVPSVALSECSVCLQQVLEKVSTECGHAFCAMCTVKLLSCSSRIKCPLCRRKVTRKDELSTVRYSELESFTLTATVSTLQLDKDMRAAATLGDVMALKSEVSKLSQQLQRIQQAIDG